MPNELEQMFSQIGLHKIFFEKEKDLTRNIEWIRVYYRK